MAPGIPIPLGISGVPGHVECRALKAFAAGDMGRASPPAAALIHGGGFADDGQRREEEEERTMEDGHGSAGMDSGRGGEAVVERGTRGVTGLMEGGAAVAEEEEEEAEAEGVEGVEEKRDEVSWSSLFGVFWRRGPAWGGGNHSQLNCSSESHVIIRLYPW